MTTILCTLYNSLYLDKGLVLYDSLCECAKDFKLYVLCMDDKCYEVLVDLHQEHTIPIRLSDFESGDEKLLKAKESRSFGEYCWTCTPSLILYILKKYNEPICTYIDADMYFYQDPQILIDEMFNAGKTVLIVPHRFPAQKKYLEKHGIYCVQFNTFCNADSSNIILEKWRSNCIADSSIDGNNFGDQKYLDTWPTEYSCIHVTNNLGAGLAPWNIESYKLVDNQTNIVLYKENGLKLPVVFYHFQNLTYIDRKQVSTNFESNNSEIDYRLVDHLYVSYLKKIDKRKDYLIEKHDLDVIIKEHPVLSSLGLFWHFKGWASKLFNRILFKKKSAPLYTVQI